MNTKQSNPNLIELTEPLTKNGKTYQTGTMGELVGTADRDFKKIGIAIRIADDLIEDIEDVKYKKLYNAS